MKKFIRKDDKAVSPVIAVILMVAITVVLAGVLWAMLSQLGGNEETAINISAKNPVDKGYAYTVEITDISGSLNLEDAKFQIITSAGTLQAELTTTQNTNPAGFLKGASMVYAMQSSGTAMDNTTSAAVTGLSSFQAYENCMIAYLDQTNDGKINGGDTMYIFQDPDGTASSGDEVSSGYSIKIITGDSMALQKKF